MNKEELMKYIEDKRLELMAEYLKTEIGIKTQKEVYEAEEDLIANYYETRLPAAEPLPGPTITPFSPA